MRFFEGKDVIALTSDSQVDFTPTDFDAPLTEDQRNYLKSQCGLDFSHVFWRKQIHGDDVLVAKDSSRSSRGCPDADAYITNQKNLPIAIRTADCVPVFLYDPSKPAIGIAHAGWKGTFKEIAYKTVIGMKENFGCKTEDVYAVLGPAIGPCCYQVKEEFRQYFPEEIIDRADKIYVDIIKNNYQQLLKAGLKKENISNAGICTNCNLDYFSFRRDKEKAGRMISLMMLI
ncbi:MAG: peptidoglycan editing factor PgeF [Candidatus Omnitrophota bacterium]